MVALYFNKIHERLPSFIFLKNAKDALAGSLKFKDRFSKLPSLSRPRRDRQSQESKSQDRSEYTDEDVESQRVEGIKGL